MECASKTATQFSIAGITGITESHSVGATIGTAFPGNTFSGISDTVTHVATGHFSRAYDDIALGGAAQGLPFGSSVSAKRIVGAVTDAGVDAALGEGIASPVGWTKLGIDGAGYLGSVAYLVRIHEEMRMSVEKVFVLMMDIVVGLLGFGLWSFNLLGKIHGKRDGSRYCPFFGKALGRYRYIWDSYAVHLLDGYVRFISANTGINGASRVALKTKSFHYL